MAAVLRVGLEDLVGHLFLQQREWCRYWRTWLAVRQGRVVRSWTDYILGSERRIFQNVTVQDPRHKNFMVVVFLCGTFPR